MREAPEMVQFFYLGDQLGDSLCPDMVSSWDCVPSASMVQIWRSPLRVDSKTMWRPSGAQLGRSFFALSRGSWMIWRVKGSLMLVWRLASGRRPPQGGLLTCGAAGGVCTMPLVRIV